MSPALTLACVGHGGICRAVVDVPFAHLASPRALQLALATAGWTLVLVPDPKATPEAPRPGRVEVRCPACQGTDRPRG